jgi:hypothetical protein
MSDDPILVPRSPGPLESITLALRERLILAFPTTKFDHQFVPPRVSKKQWDTLLRRPPFVGIGWMDLDPKRKAGARTFTADAMFNITLVTVNQGGVKPGLLGDTLAPGIMRMVGAAIGVLHGYSFPDIGTATVTHVSAATSDDWENENLFAASLDLSIDLSMPLNAVFEEIPADALITTSIQWAFSGGAGATLTDFVTTGDA